MDPSTEGEFQELLSHGMVLLIQISEAFLMLPSARPAKTKGRMFPALINKINNYNYHRERLKRDRRDKSKSPRGTGMKAGMEMFNPGSSSHTSRCFSQLQVPHFHPGALDLPLQELKFCISKAEQEFLGRAEQRILSCVTFPGTNTSEAFGICRDAEISRKCLLCLKVTL